MKKAVIRRGRYVALVDVPESAWTISSAGEIVGDTPKNVRRLRVSTINIAEHPDLAVCDAITTKWGTYYVLPSEE